MNYTITRNTNTRRMESSEPHLHALYAAMPPYPAHAGGDDDRIYGERLLNRAQVETDGDVRRLIAWALKFVRGVGVPEVDIPWQASYELHVPVRYIKAHLRIVAASVEV